MQHNNYMIQQLQSSRLENHNMLKMKSICTIGLFYLIQILAKDNVFKFFQDDYVMDFERMELASMNNKGMKQFALRTFKYNRTCPLVNMTKIYNVDLGNELQVIVQAYRFASNEYRIFPIRLQVNFCDAIKQNLIGCGRFLNCGNFTGCPFLKGVRYHICNFSPDQTQFPPLIPDGHYMLELQGLYRSMELWVIKAYGIVSRPIKMN